jgi:uncharacterized protein (DUF1778 family)
VLDVARIHIVIPDDLHRRAKSAAALNGQTLKDFLTDALDVATRAAEKKPTKRTGRLSK